MYLCDYFVHHVRPHSVAHFVWFGYFDGDGILVLWLRSLEKKKKQENNFYALKAYYTFIKNTQERLKKKQKNFELELIFKPHLFCMCGWQEG